MSGELPKPDANGSAPTSPITTTTDAAAAPTPTTSSGPPPAASGAPSSAGLPKAVDDVMHSDIGINTLLNRLKQSIASARDFAAFLKKRSTLEEDQATGLKRLTKAQLDGVKRQDAKSGSYAAQLAEVMRVHERMADNGMQFALSLHQMHEDLNELSANMERGRKTWKHEGLASEKNASDAEAAMYKAKSKYDALAEDYDRARTGDTKGSKRIGPKGFKSMEEYEQGLLKKTQTADSDYAEKVKQAKSQREILLSTGRPKAVKALQDLIQECDSGLTLQLQKFATFNEKLLLGNGLAVTPLADKETTASHRSLRDIIYEIDNETDFHAYMRGHVNKIPARPSEIKYEQHPTLAPKTQKPTEQKQPAFGQASPSSQVSSQPPSLSVNTAGPASSQPSSMNSRYGSQPQPSYQQQSQPPSVGSQTPATYHPQSPSAGQNQPQAPMYGGHPQPPYPASQSSARDTYSSGGFSTGPPAPPYPAHAAERTGSPFGPHQQTSAGSMAPPAANRKLSNTSPTNNNNSSSNLPPLRPVFGVSLDELFQRDQAAVPPVVVQCILAVDTFGLDVEGIYRLSGTASSMNALKAQFDHDPTRIDFRNPAAFYHDVNSVASLLKQFFRDLPDPLFTNAAYSSFIENARIEDPEQRRDELHKDINDLPDPNYATLRALVLHLHRVMQNEGKNRMPAGNLALCFAPSLMGTQTGEQIADASLQARVLSTILHNATAIFDED